MLRTRDIIWGLRAPRMVMVECWIYFTHISRWMFLAMKNTTELWNAGTVRFIIRDHASMLIMPFWNSSTDRLLHNKIMATTYGRQFNQNRTSNIVLYYYSWLFSFKSRCDLRIFAFVAIAIVGLQCSCNSIGTQEYYSIILVILFAPTLTLLFIKNRTSGLPHLHVCLCHVK